MGYMYKIHRWVSTICAVFFLLLCATGLILLFRQEIFSWNQADSGTVMSMEKEPAQSFDYRKGWAGLEAGQAAVSSAYAAQRIQAVFVQPEDGTLMFRIQDKNSHEAVRTMMRMGGRQISFDPATGHMMEMTYGTHVRYPAVSSFVHTIHVLHTRLGLENGGVALLALVCTLILVSLLSGIILYGPFMKGSSFGEIRSFPAHRKWMDIHKMTGMLTGMWAVVLTASGILILFFSAAYRDYTASVSREAQAHFASAGETGSTLSLTSAFQAVQEQFPHDYILSVQLPSGKSSAYSFYMTPASDHPDTFFGQPVLAAGTAGGTADIYTRPVPWYIRASALGVDVHIHNHGTPLLKWIWAFLTVTTMVMIVSAFISFWKKKLPSGRGTHQAVRRRRRNRKSSVWLVPAGISLLSLAGLILPLQGEAGSWAGAAAFVTAGIWAVVCVWHEKKQEKLSA